MRLLPSGSTAVLVEVDDLAAVLGLQAALAAAPPPGVVDVVPAARTVLLVVDPAVTSVVRLCEHVRALDVTRAHRAPTELVEITVDYDGPDLVETAALLQCDPVELVRRHTAAEWTVAFGGFSPGFAYLTSPDWPWEVPRRPSPRTRVPAGSVGLAAGFSGVYPQGSPGGWHLIGRTDQVLFDPTRDPAAVLRPGARVRFVAGQSR
ncbi:MAG: 5-oxoprolinase subunit B family protein [Marmoricola sp.]